MQVVEVGDALGVVAGLGVGRDVVDQFIADPDHAPVVERLEVLLSGSQHVRGSLPVSRGALAAPSLQCRPQGGDTGHTGAAECGFRTDFFGIHTRLIESAAVGRAEAGRGATALDRGMTSISDELLWA